MSGIIGHIFGITLSKIWDSNKFVINYFISKIHILCTILYLINVKSDITFPLLDRWDMPIAS